MNGAMLIRFLTRDGIKGQVNFERSWVGDLSRVGSIGLPEIVIEEIKRFWNRNEPVLFLRHIAEVSKCEVVVERVDQGRSLFIFGAGHVGRSIALLGALLGLEVTLIDDRQDLLGEDMMPISGVHALSGSFDKIGDSILLNKKSAIVIVTRGHQYDEVILKQMVHREIGYIGMIGSRRRIEGIFRRLRREGVSELFLESVKAPIGLNIGAVSPQEIAVAVHAEIIKHFSYDRASDNINILNN